nr:cell division cycle-associated protein 4 isoform X4 [Anser cygnoides]
MAEGGGEEERLSRSSLRAAAGPGPGLLPPQPVAGSPAPPRGLGRRLNARLRHRPLRAGRHGNGGRPAPGGAASAFVGSDNKMAGGRGAGPGAALGSARSLRRGAVAEAGAGLPAAATVPAAGWCCPNCYCMDSCSVAWEKRKDYIKHNYCSGS